MHGPNALNHQILIVLHLITGQTFSENLNNICLFIYSLLTGLSIFLLHGRECKFNDFQNFMTSEVLFTSFFTKGYVCNFYLFIYFKWFNVKLKILVKNHSKQIHLKKKILFSHSKIFINTYMMWIIIYKICSKILYT